MDDKDIRLDGRHVLVAGAGGGGIGTAVAVIAARAGARVLAVDRTEQGRATAEQALAETGGTYRVADVDLTDRAALASALQHAQEAFGPIRGAVNVVGGMRGREQFAPLLDENGPDLFREIIDFNLRATLNASNEVARAMIAHGQGGSIVQIASNTGLVSMPFGAGYGAAKAALLNLTRTMAVEWGAKNIRVNAIAVGMIRTAHSHKVVKEVDQSARQAIPLGRVGRSEEIAGPVLFLLSDLASYVTGATLGVDGGAMARSPYNDGDNLPVFVNDAALRERLLG